MSTMPINQAAQAYGRVLQQGLGAGEGGSSVGTPAGQSFAELVGSAVDTLIAKGKSGENQSFQAMVGKADIADIVTAVSSAEMALDTVVAVRDKVIGAYQEIMRMPV